MPIMTVEVVSVSFFLILHYVGSHVVIQIHELYNYQILLWQNTQKSMPEILFSF